MQSFKNSSSGYGVVSIILHWLMAALFVGMYILGNHMVGLDYYDSWYHKAPERHKSFGITLIIFMAFRFFWNQLQLKLIYHKRSPFFTRLARLPQHHQLIQPLQSPLYPLFEYYSLSPESPTYQKQIKGKSRESGLET